MRSTWKVVWLYWKVFLGESRGFVRKNLAFLPGLGQFSRDPSIQSNSEGVHWIELDEICLESCMAILESFSGRIARVRPEL